MRTNVTLPAQYFEDKYKNDIDPWRFRTSPYERDKYAATLRALTKTRYRSGLEVGCSIGVFTRLLAAHCQTLIAIDTSAIALAAAKETNQPNVVFKQAALPGQFPAGAFDLIVLSEVLYYFDKPDLQLVARQCVRSIAPQGEIIVCHWLGETDYPLTGTGASETFAQVVSSPGLSRTIIHDETYRLERYALA